MYTDHFRVRPSRPDTVRARQMILREVDARGNASVQGGAGPELVATVLLQPFINFLDNAP